MARAHFVTYVLDQEGRPIQGATVEVRQQGDTAKITETIFANDVGDDTEKNNPFVGGSDGKVEFFLDSPQRVDLLVSKSGFDPQTITVDVFRLEATTITFSDDATPVAQRSEISFEDGFVLSDDAVNDEIEVDIDYGGAGELTDLDMSAEAVGSSIKLSRADHKHRVTPPGAGYPVDIDMSAEADGTSDTPARSDHKHHVTEPGAGYPVESDMDAESDGTADTPARSDHKHRITPPNAGETLDAVLGGSSGPGTSPRAARADHNHRVVAANAAEVVDVAETEADGTSNRASRADHRHAHGSGYLPDAHHPKSHIHDGVDGSGTVAHSATTGKGTDDHHAQNHASRHRSGGADALEVAKVALTDKELPNEGVPQVDDDLTVVLPEAGTWVMRYTIIYMAPGTRDINIQFNSVSADFGWWTAVGPDAGATEGAETDIKRSTGPLGESRVFGGLGASTPAALEITVSLKISGSRTVQFQWAQGSSGAVPTIRKAGSQVEAHRVA